MKIQQLRYIVEIASQNLNFTDAAEALYTSQPGISKQVRLLEDELGLEIFERNGKHIKSITPEGEKIIEIAKDLLAKVQNIKSISDEVTSPDHGVLRIATTNTQARYVLPEVIKRFNTLYPNVVIHIHQGAPSQLNEALTNGEVDLAITTEAQYIFENAVLLPCYSWNRSAIVPKTHPLANCKELTIEELAKYPLITYTFGFNGPSELSKAFSEKGLIPKTTVTATDADVIKTYVRLGLGVGIMASMAHTAEDSDLVAIDASHLFNYSSTQIAFKKGTFLRYYIYDFINFFSEHLTRTVVEKAERCPNNKAVAELFKDITLKVR